MRAVVVMVVLGIMAAGASAAVVVGGTETFTSGVNGGADWGVGGPSAYDGWQVDLFKGYDSRPGNNDHKEYFGSTGQILTDWPDGRKSKGQPDPGSRSGDPGTLVVQHNAFWNGADPAKGEADPPSTCTQLKYISFNSVAGTVYELTGWVNTVFIQHGTAWDGMHPRIVDHNNPPMPAQFPDIQIGLKNGLADANDLDITYTQVTNLIDNMAGGVPNPNAWVQFSVSAIGDGGPMTILLKVAAPDISSGAVHENRTWDVDVRFDDITLTPEPTTLVLLSLGLFLVRRR